MVPLPRMPDTVDGGAGGGHPRRPGIGLVLLLVVAMVPGLGLRAESELTVLTNAAQVLQLGVEGARRSRHPVDITGVLTCPLNVHQWLYVQDATAGMLVLYTNGSFRGVTGQVIRVRGRAFAGQFAAHVSEASVEVLGRGPLPEPKRGDPGKMAAGADFGSWVQVEGRVVDVLALGGATVLEVVSGRHRFRVLGPTREVGVVPSGEGSDLAWLDARVEVRGVCWTEMDRWNRPVGFRVHAPDPACVRVLEPGGPDPFDRPRSWVSGLMSAEVPRDARVRVRGTVTHVTPDQWVFLRDGTGSVRALLLPRVAGSEASRVYRERSGKELAVGDVVDVVGYVRRAGATMVMTEGEARYLEAGGVVAPLEVPISALAQGGVDGALVTVQGTVVERGTRVWGAGVEERLRLAGLEGGLQASLRVARTNELPPMPRGTVVRVTGVCYMTSAEFGALPVPQMVLRSPADVAVVRSPRPWETLPPGQVLAVSGLLGVVALVWIGVLSRRVRHRRREEEALRRSLAPTRILSYFATSLLERHDEAEILWDLAKNCVARLGFVDCVVYLLDRERGVLVQRAAHGPKNPGPGLIRDPLEIPLGRGIVGSVAASGQAEVVSDTRRDGRYIVDDAFRLSEIAVPIVAGGEVIGVIDSEHPRAGFFTTDHRELLASIASLCANKLVRVRSERRLRELNQELEGRIEQRTVELVEANQRLRAGLEEKARASRVERALFEISEAVPAAADLPALYARIHAIIGTLMRADNFYLALEDPGTGLVSFPYHRDLVDPAPAPRRGARGMTEYVLRTGRPMLADLEEIRRLKEAGEYVQSGHPSAIWLGVPLTLNGRTFGVMAVQDQHDPRAFDAEDKRWLSFVAGQTALAIDRKRQEAELQARTRLLRESEERFGKAFRAMPAGLSILRLADERLLEVNDAFLVVSGFTRPEVLGCTLAELELWVDHESPGEFLERARATGSVKAFETRLRTKLGGEETVLMSAEGIELNGEPCALVLVIVITARKRAEEELLRTLAQERELSELKSRFVSMVSHEFRTPLGIILSAAEILEAYFERLPPDRRREHLDDIRQATCQMAGFMEEALLIGRSEAGQLECHPGPVDLGVLCRVVASEVGAATQGRCRIEAVGDLNIPEVMADTGLLRHIVTNLLSNAVKYSPAGGVVEMEIGPVEGGVELVVRDRGVGIPEADADRVFQAFHRGSNVGEIPGTGLGLMIVRRCVEVHGGRIGFRSREGGGTSFSVWLPVSAPVAVATSRMAEAVDGGWTGGGGSGGSGGRGG